MPGVSFSQRSGLRCPRSVLNSWLADKGGGHFLTRYHAPPLTPQMYADQESFVEVPGEGRRNGRQVRSERFLEEVIYSMDEEIKDSESDEPCDPECLLSLVCFSFIIP